MSRVHVPAWYTQVMYMYWVHTASVVRVSNTHEILYTYHVHTSAVHVPCTSSKCAVHVAGTHSKSHSRPENTVRSSSIEPVTVLATMLATMLVNWRYNFWDLVTSNLLLALATYYTQGVLVV